MAPPDMSAISGVDMYRIIPKKGVYKVEAVAADGQSQTLKIWPTEEAALLHLKDLQAADELADRLSATGGSDWRD